MKRLAVLFVIGLVGALVFPVGSVGAQVETTDAYVVHGLNLDNQSSPAEGGTATTLCIVEQLVDSDFQFGEVIASADVASGTWPLRLYEDANVDCADPGKAPLIDQPVQITGAAMAIVATSNGDQISPEFLEIPLDVSCVDPGMGRAVAVHAAAGGEVEVVNDVIGPVGNLSYGSEPISGSLPVGTYGIVVNEIGGSSNPVMSFDVTVQGGMSGIGYAVGGQPLDGPSPLVLIEQYIDVGFCQPSPTTSTTTTTVAPTTTAAAQPQALQPTITG